MEHIFAISDDGGIPETLLLSETERSLKKGFYPFIIHCEMNATL